MCRFVIVVELDNTKSHTSRTKYNIRSYYDCTIQYTWWPDFYTNTDFYHNTYSRARYTVSNSYRDVMANFNAMVDRISCAFSGSVSVPNGDIMADTNTNSYLYSDINANFNTYTYFNSNSNSNSDTGSSFVDK